MKLDECIFTRKLREGMMRGKRRGWVSELVGKLDSVFRDCLFVKLGL